MASKRRVKRHVCGRKQEYGTLGFAIKVAKRMQDKHFATFDAYKCPYGDHYHVGHRTQGVRAQMKLRYT